MLSPSPSPDRIAAREPPLGAQTPAINHPRLGSSPSSPPRQPVRASTASHRSPLPLPRLEIRDDAIQSPDSGNAAHSSASSKQQLPAVYQAQYQATKDYYPNPISVGEMRWPAQCISEDDRVSSRPAATRPRSTGNSPDGNVDPLSSEAYAPPPTVVRPQQPAHVRPGHPQPALGMIRPRLSIQPYASPVISHGENRYWSAGGVPPHLGGAAHDRSYSSPSGVLSSNNFKAPGKRADDLQLNVLNEVFDRTSYPSTEEREDLARRLGMTSRSVQIWFQNRRRAVKVEHQSAIQRAEADVLARSRGIPAPYLAEPYLSGSPARMRPGPAPSSGSASGPHSSASRVQAIGNRQGYSSIYANLPGDQGHHIIKREVKSQERDRMY